MATFFSGQNIGYWSSTSNYIYGTLTGNVSRSGNTVTLSGMNLSLTTRYTSTGSGQLWFEVNGTRTTFTASASGTSLGSHGLNNTSFSVSTSQTSASVSWKSSDGNTGSFTVTFPSGATVPNTPTISLEGFGAGTVTISYGTTSFGTAGSGTVYLYQATNSSFTDEVQVASKTTTGQSSVTIGNLSHRETYYYRSRANSTVGNSSYSSTVGPVTPNPAVKIYGSVNGSSTMIVTPYGSVNGKTKVIKKIYGSVEGKTKLIYN